MSLFDFPRINIKGTVSLNPGTANNDDYAGAYFLPNSWGEYAGQTLGLVDSKLVQPRTFGLSDPDFIAWIQKRQPFDTANGPRKTIPAEWNYYGDMSSTVGPNDATVIGVQTAPDQIYSAADPAVPITSLIGSSLTYNGNICDVNSEGSPPATQFFIDKLTLMNGAAVALQGSLSKGACQWINFYRNVNLTADGGAGGYMYHVMRRDQCSAPIAIPGFDDPRIVGVIFRYYLYRTLQGTTDQAQLEEIYVKQQYNPATIQFIATIAPLYEDEELFTGPAGRLLVANTPTIPTPTSNNNGGGKIALAPAVLQQRGNLLSAEFVGTFPDNYDKATGSNDKFDFGAVTLVATTSGSTPTTATIGPVDYANTAAGDQRGWLFDFDLSQNAAARQVLADPAATFHLVQATLGNVLDETPFYVVSNQQAMYAEQHGPGDAFVNQGTPEPATIGVYQYGKPLAKGACPPVTVWSYSTVPMQSPGTAVPIHLNFQPGDPITVDTSRPGNFLFTFTVGTDAPPTQSYLNFMNPPYITNAPSMSLRILPNDEDFSQYYADPAAKEPVGNDQLTFDVVFAKVLRTYYLLYPVMNFYFPLNDEKAVNCHAQGVLARTDPAIWGSIGYMPRTRDMSASRRTLLQAWCRKVMAEPGWPAKDCK
jgi:hypothetical protein